ncbi:hypothetical protein Goklo_007846 [Gossypium klotzschianum]|uniref:Uncharacterized protein n=3 Tax=Gossypium TaxID=3633 RepID=A0A7J8UYI5_9ROSI|nr:hypothetical protein [Gossypium klotzschianum]
MVGKNSYLAMRSEREATDLIASDFQDLIFATKKLANHAIKLGSWGFGTTLLEWIASFAAMIPFIGSACFPFLILYHDSVSREFFLLSESYLLILDRTNWKTNILTALLIPYIFLSLPSFLFNILRGEVGKWIAFIAVVLRLFFPTRFPDWLELPGALILLIVVAPSLFSSTIRNDWIGVVICLGIACYLLQEHIRASGGFRNSFTKANGISNTIGIIILLVYPAWALVTDIL